MEIDRRVTRRYELTNEDERLWSPGTGDLVRLRTWDIFERHLPPSGTVLDVGGGPGTHAAHLADRGYEVTLLDPVARHVEAATRRAEAPGAPAFEAKLGHARALPLAVGSVDVVLLLGPLYHLVEPHHRHEALREARRVLRPGGRLLCEVISRHAWVLDATVKDILDHPQLWADVERSTDTGLSQDTENVRDGAFWAYFHRPGELRAELEGAGFEDVRLLAVEGFAWLLGDLERRMATPEPLLRAVRLTEDEPSMLGCSAHIIGVATR